MRRLAEVIDKCDNAETVGIAGCKIFSFTYGGKLDGNVTKQHYQKFNSMMAQSNSTDVPRISPPERTAHFYTLRIHLQTRVWQLLDEAELDPCNWGWKLTSKGYFPIPTDLPPAPDSVLNFIRRNCKFKKNQCGTQL